LLLASRGLDGHGKFGGTCVNDGCTPTKAPIASAYAAHMARRAGGDVMHDGEPGNFVGSRRRTISSGGPAPAGFAHLRGPLMGNVGHHY
jgi:hypothetical protein